MSFDKSSYTHRLGDWKCVCETMNFSSRNECFKCKKRKGGGFIQKDNKVSLLILSDWKCKCGSLNFAKRIKCMKCSLTKLDNYQSERSRDEVYRIKDSKIPMYKTDWTCTHCRDVNFAKRERCRTCEEKKPPSSQARLSPRNHLSSNEEKTEPVRTEQSDDL